MATKRLSLVGRPEFAVPATPKFAALAAQGVKPILVDDKEYMPGVYEAMPNKDWAEEEL
jgi:hypothetical protein